MMAFMIKLVGLYGFAFSRQTFFLGGAGGGSDILTPFFFLMSCVMFLTLLTTRIHAYFCSAMVEEKTGGEGEAWR